MFAMATKSLHEQRSRSKKLIMHPESLRVSQSVLVDALAGIIIAILRRWLVLPHVHPSNW